MNKVILMGRLVKDPELKQTPSGVSVARFSIAVNRRFKNDNGEYDADFINCVAWRQTSEFITKYFQKGSMIAITGSIQVSTWDDKEGKRQYSTEVVVDEAYFTGSKGEASGTINTAANDQIQAGVDSGFIVESDGGELPWEFN